jgi:predicted negative regulator of RcsB-dependent stress response
MNAVAADPRPGFFKRSWKALNSALLVALIVAFGSWGFQLYQTRVAANQASNLQQISDFTADAAATDRAVVRFFNAVSEGKSLDQPREKVEDALVGHSIKVEQLREVLGPARAEQYLAAIEQLQNAIEETTDATRNGPNETAFGKVIELRREMISQARREA